MLLTRQRLSLSHIQVYISNIFYISKYLLFYHHQSSRITNFKSTNVLSTKTQQASINIFILWRVHVIYIFGPATKWLTKLSLSRSNITVVIFRINNNYCNNLDTRINKSTERKLIMLREAYADHVIGHSPRLTLRGYTATLASSPTRRFSLQLNLSAYALNENDILLFDSWKLVYFCNKSSSWGRSDRI